MALGAKFLFDIPENSVNTEFDIDGQTAMLKYRGLMGNSK